jgi:YidC/Oxa1 family membrane protein insertase
MQAKNFILFILLAIAIWVGWSYVQHTFFPQPKPADKEKEKEKEEKPKTRKVKPLEPPLGEVGLALGSPFAVAAKRFKYRFEPPYRLAQPLEMVARFLGTPFAIAARQLRVRFEPTFETVTLGRDKTKYHLNVVLTTRGGGVQSLILNQFKAADADGRPIGDDELLELIPHDSINPSFLLYHYPDPKLKKSQEPIDTLGRIEWRIVRKKDKKWVETNEFKPETDDDDVQTVTFQTSRVPGYPKLTIRKTYTLAPGTYHLRLKVEFENGGEDRIFRTQLAGAHGLPIEGKWFTATFRNALVGRVDPGGSLWRSHEDSRQISVRMGGNRVPESDLGNDAIQYAAVTTQFFASAIVVETDDPFVEWVRPTLEATEMRGKLKILFAGARLLVLIDDDDKEHTFKLAESVENDDLNRFKPGQTVWVRYRWLDEDHLIAHEIRPGSSIHRPQLDDITVRVNTIRFSLPHGETKSHEYMLYNGPAKVRLLRQLGVENSLVDKYEHDLHLNTLTDYQWNDFFKAIQWTNIVLFFTNLMHGLLNLLHYIVPQYGLCIILLTVLVRGLMFPISRKQAYLSMRMQALGPEMKKVQEKYKNDPQARTHAIMDLYRRHGVNPFAGCLPLLLQMPIFLGLYYALQESIFFRLAPFLWIQNLAAPDMLIYWGPNIPIISDPGTSQTMLAFLYLGPYFNILPVIAVTVMMFHQKIMTPPAMDEQQAMQQKMFKYMMIFMGLMFYKVASGLCIYFIASSLWGLAERKLLPKAAKTLPTAPETKAPPKPPPKGKKSGKGSKDGEGTFQKVKDWWSEVLKQAKKK